MKRHAFTLVEMMLVVGIMSTLALVAAQQYSGASLRAKESVLREQLATVRGAARAMFADTGLYPDKSFATDLSSHDLPATGRTPAGAQYYFAYMPANWHGPYLRDGTVGNLPGGLGTISYDPSKLSTNVEAVFKSTLTGNDSNGTPYSSY